MGRVKRRRLSVFRNILEQQYDENTKYKLIRSVKGCQDWVQRLGLLKILPAHSGCVNCICWNERGDALLSGSDDQRLVISHAFNYRTLANYRTSHRANIFSAKFLPCTNDSGIVSCSGDGMIQYTDTHRLDESTNNIFNCHVGTTYEVATVPCDPNVFLSCGEDCTVRSFDLRKKESCVKARCMDVCNEDIIVAYPRAITAITINPNCPYELAIGCSDSTVRLYDRRMLTPGAGETAKALLAYIAQGMEGKNYRITSLSFSPKGDDLLVSYSSEHLYLFGVKNGETAILNKEPTPEEPMTLERLENESPLAPVRRLRLRGDWSDTGPDARPQNYIPPGGGLGRMRPTLHGTLMQRMTDVLSRMLNDPAVRAGLSQGGEGAFPDSDQSSQSLHGGSEGEGDDDPVPNYRDGSGTSASNTTENSLPSFSSSFTQPPPAETQSENMDVDDHAASPRTGSSEESEQPEEIPSTSSSPPEPSTSTSSHSKKFKNPHFKELSSAYQGFVEKTGVEPMVNLIYSDVGSTASSISVFVDKNESEKSQNVENEKNETGSSSSSSSHENKNNSQDAHESQGSSSKSKSEHDVHRPDEEQSSTYDLFNAHDSDDSDCEFDPGIKCTRKIHPIEKHMDEAIKNARSEEHKDIEEEPANTRKCFFTQKYVGHRNARTMIKEATFWGDDYVISGSDCGHVFMWEKETGRLRMLLEADHHVVNCVQPHPFLPILATSGIDYDVKLWAPIRGEPAFEQEMADELMKRNAVMLEETKDTITVPASFMIRMLACLNQIRRGVRSRQQQQRFDSSTNSD